MREICEKLNIPESIRDVAYRIFKEVSNMGTCRGSIVSRPLCCCIQHMSVCGPCVVVPLLLHSLLVLFQACTSMPPSCSASNPCDMQVRDAQAVKGRAQSAIQAACIFVACKMRGAPRTFKEIGAAAPEAKTKDIGRCFTAIDK